VKIAATIAMLVAAALAAPPDARPAAAAPTDSSSYDTWLKLCIESTESGTRAQFDGLKQRAGTAFEEAVIAGRRAVVLAPNRAEGHQELAVALGSLALHKGGKEKIRLSKELKSEVDRALALNPRLHRAHHVLARWHRGVAQLNVFERTAAKVIYGGVPEGATMDAAITHFERAIELAPDYANHRLELGRTYLDIGLKAKARAEFERAIACPNHSTFDPDYKREAQQLMAKTR
jgi:tetratricopeptide (TPR) repeat protein